MKHLLLLALFAVCGSPAFAQDPEAVFREANQEYQSGNFAAAAEKYESLVANGFESGPLYYNLGNAAFKSGNIARAILNYERGLRLTPDEEDLVHNLELSKLMTVDRIEAVQVSRAAASTASAVSTAALTQSILSSQKSTSVRLPLASRT